MTRFLEFVFGLVCCGIFSCASATTVTLTASTASTVIAHPIRFSVQVDGDSPTGHVIVMVDDGSAICEMSITTVYPSTGVCTTYLSSIAAGNHQLTASFAGDANNPSAVSAPITIAVNPTARLALSIVNTYGQSITTRPSEQTISFTAQIGPDQIAPPAPTGGVSFSDGTHTLCQNVPLVSDPVFRGTAMCTVALQDVGMHRITAHYAGDANYPEVDANEYDIFISGIIPDSERAVLDAIYAQTNGAQWSVYSADWLAARGQECFTYGVVCDDDGTHVIGLALSNRQMIGMLPDLSGLPMLEFVDISDNALVGPLPNLGALIHLKAFDASGNSQRGYYRFGLGGTLPDLKNCTELVAFKIRQNQLTGTLPNVSTLSKLQIFDVSSNQFTGTLPELANLPALTYVDVSDNAFSGSLPELASLAQLQYFDAHENVLTGAIPALSTLQNLTTFVVYQNHLSGSLPALTGLHNLQVFDADNNNLSGAMPSLSGLGMLQQLDVSYNQLSGSVPPLTDLASLTRFSIEFNQLSGALPLPPSVAPLTPGASALCYNKLTITAAAVWDQATAVSPWYADCQKSAATVTANATPSTIAGGATFQVQIKVSATSGGSSPTGGAGVFDLDGGQYCAVTLVNGASSCTINNLSTSRVNGSTSNVWLVVVYGGDSKFAATAAAFKETIAAFAPGQSATNVYPSLAALYFGQPVTFTALIQGNAPSGSVDFLDGNTVLCQGVGVALRNGEGLAQCATTNLAGGAHSIVARYSGDAHNAASASPALSISIGKIPTTLTMAISSNSIVIGDRTTVTANLSYPLPSSVVPTGTITVSAYSYQTAPGCVITLPATSCTFSLPTIYNPWMIYATYSGDDYFSSPNSASAEVNVMPRTSTLELSASATTAIQGQPIAFYALVGGTSAPGSILFTDLSSFPAGATVCARTDTLSNGQAQHATCKTAALSVGSHTIQAFYQSDDDDYAGSVATTTVNITARTTINLNQWGLSGAWYDQATSGQGFVFEVFPDISGLGNGLFTAGWFTFDSGTPGGTDKQRWYTLGGSVDSVDTTATIDIYTAIGGNFDAPPNIDTAKVGQAEVTFTDCSHASLNYSFSDGSQRNGAISLTRLSSPATCSVAGTAPRASGYNGQQWQGAWYNPDTSGQGLLINVDNISTDLSGTPNYNLFGAWYTFAPDGQQVGNVTSQRWYTLQGGMSFVDLAPTGGMGVMLNPVNIFESTGGIFDHPAQPTTKQVGSMTMTMLSCATANLNYQFSAGSNAGLNGTIKLVRLGTSPYCN